MVLVGGEGLGVRQPLRVVRVRVAGEQRADGATLGDLGVEAVHGRGARLGRERSPVGVRRVRVGPEVVVERLVLVEEHDEVLDGRGGAALVDRLRHSRGRLVASERGVRRGARACSGGHRRGACGDNDRRRAYEVGPEPAAPAPSNWAKAHAQPPEFCGTSSAGAPGRPPPGQCEAVPRRRTVSWLNDLAARSMRPAGERRVKKSQKIPRSLKKH